MSIMVGLAVNFRLSSIPWIRCLTLLWRFPGMQFVMHISLLNESQDGSWLWYRGTSVSASMLCYDI